MSIWTRAFWKATAERAIKSAAQGAVAAIGVNAVGVLDLDGVAVLSAAGLMFLLSILTSVGSDLATGDGPSLGHTEVLPVTVDPDPVELDGGR